MRYSLLFLLIRIFCLPVFADPEPIRFPSLPLSDGEVLTNVTVRKIEGDTVSVIHSSGATRIPYEKLPADAAKRLGLTADSVAKTRENQALQESDLKRSQKIAELSNSLAGIYFAVVTGKVLQVLPDGALVDAKLWKGRFTAIPDAIKGVWTHSANFDKAGTIRLYCDSRALVDGDPVFHLTGEAPAFSYTTVLGAVKTVKSYTTDLVSTCELIMIDGQQVTKVVPAESIVAAVKRRFARTSFEEPLH